MADENNVVKKERKSVSKLTKMFENKTTEVTRKSAQNKDALKALKDDLNKTYNETEEIDDIFDDLTMPNTVRKRTNSVLDKVQMFNKTDIKDAQKILKTVSQIASDNIYLKPPINQEQSKSTRSCSFNIEINQPINKNEILRKNSEPIKEISISPVKKQRPMSVRQMINKIEKVEDMKKEKIEESKSCETEESVDTVVQDKISIINETSEYDDTSKRIQDNVVSSPCKKSNEVGYKVDNKTVLGDYNQLDDTGKSMSLNQSSFIINSTFDSEICGHNVMYTSPNVGDKVKSVKKLQNTAKLSCFVRLISYFKKK